MERASAESVPLSPDTNLQSQTTEISTGLPKTIFLATTATAKSVFDTGGITIPNTPLPTAKLFSKTIKSLTHDPSLITPDLVDISGFIKHTRVKLTAEDDILTFYKNLQAQGMQCNIVLLALDAITPEGGIFHPDLPLDTRAAIDTALGTKFLDTEVVTNEYSEARDLLITTTSGSEFLFQLLMIKHPKLASVSLATVDIPSYSTTKCLYKYAKAINNYIEVERINKRLYSLKEVSYMYLSHLDSNTYESTRDNIRGAIKLTPDPIPLRYQVPGLATTITHMTNKKSANDAYVNRMQEFCIECSDEESEEDGVVNAANYRGRQQQPRQHDRNRRQYDRNRTSPPTQTKSTSLNTKYNKAPFKGSCYGCGREGHHAGECYFLMKVEQCLAYLKSNPSAGKEKAAKYRQQSSSNYRDRRAKIAHLQDENFLPYPDIDPDAFLDCIDDNILSEAENIIID